MSMSGMLMMDLLLPEIKGFMVSKRFFITAVTICSRDGKDFKFTGFPTKKNYKTGSSRLGFQEYDAAIKEGEAVHDMGGKKKVSIDKVVVSIVGFLIAFWMVMGAFPTAGYMILG